MSQKKSKKNAKKSTSFWCFEATTGFKGHLFWKSVEIAASNSSYKKKNNNEVDENFNGFSLFSYIWCMMLMAN